MKNDVALQTVQLATASLRKLRGLLHDSVTNFVCSVMRILTRTPSLDTCLAEQNRAFEIRSTWPWPSQRNRARNNAERLKFWFKRRNDFNVHDSISRPWR